MKKILFTIAFLLFSVIGNTNAQYQTASTENSKTVTHVDGNNYDVIFKDAQGKTIQEGQYLKIGDYFKPHGIWKLYDLNTHELVTKAEYDKGEQIWVETTIDGKLIRVDQMDLTVKRLKERIAALEKKIEELQD